MAKFDQSWWERQLPAGPDRETRSGTCSGCDLEVGELFAYILDPLDGHPKSYLCSHCFFARVDRALHPP